MPQLLHLPDVILAQLLRKLSRDAQLRMRLLSQLFCTRITSLLSDPRLNHLVAFQRRFVVPDALNSGMEMDKAHQFLCRLCHRFGVDDQNWALRIRIPGSIPHLPYGQHCVALARRFAAHLAIELFVSGAFFDDDCCSGGDSPLVALLEPLREQVTALSINYRADGGLPLLPLLHQLPALRSLDMSVSSLGWPRHVQALAPALVTLSSLTSLNLASNGLGNDAAFALAPALERLTALRSLDLGMNAFEGAAGVAPLLPALTALTALTSLGLAQYDYYDNDGEAIAAVAPVLKTLTGLKRLALGVHVFDASSSSASEFWTSVDKYAAAALAQDAWEAEAGWAAAFAQDAWKWDDGWDSDDTLPAPYGARAYRSRRETPRCPGPFSALQLRLRGSG
jgi:hypothetical protein